MQARPQLSRRTPVLSLALATLLPLGCSDDGGGNQDEVGNTGDSSTGDTVDGSESSDTMGSTDTTSSSDTTDATSSSESTDSSSDSGSTDTGPGPCQVDPEACELGTVCDVISGECVPEGSPCTLSGDAVACGNMQCGPGTVCDDQGSCIPVAPCGQVECEGDQCWGASCACERPIPCMTADAATLNGPFSTDLFGLEFADDCNAWMVTLRSGTDYLRRMTPGGELTEWPGVANLNMGEVKVLKALNPQLPAPPPPPPPYEDLVKSNQVPQTAGGDLGQVAITYTCCPSCGCQVNPPQGVARLIEGDMVPLPIILPAVATQGANGPFGNTAADAGPMGLTWGVDLRLYVGNANQNGDLDTADLVNQTQDFVTSFDSRVTAAAPLTAVHLLIALDTGELLRFNTQTLQSTPVVDLQVGVTGLSHDSFTGSVYASLSDLTVVEVQPFTGEVFDFDIMPALGRVAVSPDGKLWWVPAKYAVGNLPMQTWDLPLSF